MAKRKTNPKTVKFGSVSEDYNFGDFSFLVFLDVPKGASFDRVTVNTKLCKTPNLISQGTFVYVVFDDKGKVLSVEVCQ